MPQIRYSPRCVNCRRKTAKRHSTKAYTWKCKHCGFLNFGPGAHPTLERLKQLEEEERRGITVKATKTVKPAAAKTATTTVKVVGATPVKTPPAAPAAQTPQERSLWERLVYG